MSLKEVKDNLRRWGKITYKNVTIIETTKTHNGWATYTGKYAVIVDGERINEESVSLTKAFKIAAPYFK